MINLRRILTTITLRRVAIVAALVPVAGALVVGTIYGIDRAVDGGEVIGEVSVLGVDLGGLGEEDARTRLEALEEDLATTPIEVTAAGRSFTLVPAEVGYDIDTETILAEALENGREGSWIDQFLWWARRNGNDERTLAYEATYDPAAIDPFITSWELEGIDDPPYAGDVRMNGPFVEYEYPRAGTGIDHTAAAEILGAAVLDADRPAVELPVRYLVPSLTEADIDGVVSEAEALLAGPVTLTNQDLGKSIEIPRHILAESLTITRDDSTNAPTFRVEWTDGPLRDFVEPRLRSRSTGAVDAQILIEEDDTVRIIPSTPSRSPDLEPLAAEVTEAVGSVTRTGPLAFSDGFEADFSTADAEAMGIVEKISEFTTYHSCCQDRVTNIHTIADAVDGVLIAPGETFSLNDHVGERTLEKGYVYAGAIISGYVQCCDSPINIGGGTSQFTTTLYNAVFYAGLEDVYHMPHTIYFSRYPEGIEATLGYPAPDLVFRNNTDAYVLIRTEHTGTSITVKFFGDNGGIEVEAERSGRFGYTDPITRYEVNDELDHCTYPRKKKGKVKEPGSRGWSVRVYRHITYPDGTTTTEEWYWHYDGGFKVIEYNPVEPPGGCSPEEPPEEEP